MVSPLVHLEVVAGNATGMSILVEDELVIGRHAEGAGRLADDEEISRAHARVMVDERGSCEIEDLGSTNGTFVNALRISAPQRLSKGDTIELGATTLVVRELPTAETQRAPAEAPPSLQPTVVGAAIPGVEPPPAAAPAPGQGAQPPLELANDFATRPYEPVEEPPAPVEPAPVMAPDAPAEGLPAAVEPELMTEPAEPDPIPPPLRIALEIDFANRAAMIELNGEALPVQLMFDAGRWQLVKPPD